MEKTYHTCAEVGYINLIKEQGGFEFTGITKNITVANNNIATDVDIGSNMAIFTNNCWFINHCTMLDNMPFWR